jgi:ketosteroid isomerase-like protein
MTATPTPTDVIADFLAHSAPDKVEEAARRLVAEDATYISLNFDNPELKQILPWTGTRTGRQAYVDTFKRAFEWWVAEDFEITDLFNAGEDVAVFGAFTFRAITTGKTIHSPFSIHAKVREGLIVYFQFLEDTFGSARTFSPSGTWTIKNDPSGPEFEV